MTPPRWFAGIALFSSFACGSNPSGSSPPDAAIEPPDAIGPPLLECGDPDSEAPVVWNMAPLDRTIGVDAGTPLAFDIADGCGIVMSTVVLRINGVDVTPTITGDAKNVHVQFDAPVGGFALDSILAAELFAADAAGNAVAKPMTIRIWDDYTIYLRAIAGIDSTTPTTSLGYREYYHVEAAAAAEQRLAARLALGTDTAGAGVRFVTAHLHTCARDVTSARTLDVYRLSSDFDHTTATWMARSASVQWAQPGADAVPADRDATPFTTLTFQPANSFWSVAESANISSVIQAWHDDPTQNHGYLFVGSPGNLDINNGNCPMQVKGFLGRPLPE